MKALKEWIRRVIGGGSSLRLELAHVEPLGAIVGKAAILAVRNRRADIVGKRVGNMVGSKAKCFLWLQGAPLF
jgi:hypothetical protein